MKNTDTSPINKLLIRDLGIIDYKMSFKMMKHWVQIQEPHRQHELWLVSHPSVYTQGQAGKAEHILNLQGIPCVQSDRGGQVTYHGPGQVVCYFMFDLQRLGLTVKNLVQNTTDAVIALCKECGIHAFDDDKNPGVYTKEGKIASLGFRIRKHMSYHGVAINFNMDLRPFSGINPCGLRQQITQISSLSAIDQKSFTELFIQHLLQIFNFQSAERTCSWPHTLKQEMLP